MAHCPVGVTYMAGVTRMQHTVVIRSF